MENEKINSLEEFYELLKNDIPDNKHVFFTLLTRDWFSNVCEFDTSSGLALNTSLVDFLEKINVCTYESFHKDRLYRIVEHVNESVSQIIDEMKTKILRDNAMIPIHKARDFDSNCLQWISKQPGKNIREKLAGRTSIKAVRRTISIDTQENRLFKAFVISLEEKLLMREESGFFTNDILCENLLMTIQRWLKEDEVGEIGTWQNIPPNNTLLQEKRYKKIWNSWLLLRDMDENIQKDSKKIKCALETVLLWNVLSTLHVSNGIRIPQQPLFLDYDNLKIKKVINLSGYLVLPKNKYEKISFSMNTKGITITCLDQKYVVTIATAKLIITKNGETIFERLLRYKDFYDYSTKIILTIFPRVNLIKPNSTKVKKSNIESCYIDMYSVVPSYICDEDKGNLPCSLIAQDWNFENERYFLECSNANTLLFSEKNNTISMKKLLCNNDFSESLKNKAAFSFAKKIKSIIPAKNLTYVIPDFVNDFELEHIRKASNFYYDSTLPLPKSIASIFRWQSQKDFNCKKNSFVFVLDKLDSIFSITPIQAVFNAELLKIIPKSNGITWIRHPSIIINDKNKSNDGNNLLDLFDSKSLKKQSGRLSIVYDSKWTHIDNTTIEFLPTYDDFSLDPLRACIKKVCRNDKTNVYIINSFGKKPTYLKPYETINLKSSELYGAKILSDWQKKVSLIPLWKDHLPELAIKVPRVEGGISENFYLVKDTTIIPQRKKTIQIPVSERFTLPKGVKHYSFPLFQNDGGTKLHYMAELRSAVFPLSKSTECMLKMTYAYGENEPYSLVFIPTDSETAEFSSIKAEWKSLVEGDLNLDELPIPGFPARKTWFDFKRLPKKNSFETNDLLDWVKREINIIIDRYNFLIYSQSNRYCISMSKYRNRSWATDKNGENFCNIIYYSKKIFFHESNFEEFYYDEDEVSFDLEEQKPSMYVAKNITLGRTIPKDSAEKLKKSIRFPTLTIWNHGHSLSETDVPDNFRNAIFKGVNSIEIILKSERVSDSYKEELFFFLCCLHKDAPDMVSKKLLEYIKENNTFCKYYRHIALAIGSAELSWQKELFIAIIDAVQMNNLDETCILKALSILLWRSEKLIYFLDKNHINRILELLQVELKKKNNFSYNLSFNLELLFALLRTRLINDNSIKLLLAPNQAITKDFLTIINAKIKEESRKSLKITSRIEFEIEKPKAFKNTSDILYALKLYLSGETSANSIIISSISDDG